MTASSSDAFAAACSDLVGQVAVNASIAESIVAALASGKLTSDSGPAGISSALKGFAGEHRLKVFLRAWRTHGAHLSAEDVAMTLRSALACYRLARDRAHTVDTVWTGPEVDGSEVRRTEAVVSEIVSSADKQLLIVGYWLVATTGQIRALIELLQAKARAGVIVRFVLDPGQKSGGPDNFAALNEHWPSSLKGCPRTVFSWSEGMTSYTSKDGTQFGRKLHAKVIVADRYDALVTSANLTKAGLLENLEMGLRIHGPMAGAVVRHFDLLIDAGVLEQR